MGNIPKGDTVFSIQKMVCKLDKSIYGLRQTSRQWYSKFSQVLIKFGFHQSKSDYSLFTKGSGSSFVALLVYVDVIIITGSSSDIIQSLKQLLRTQFKLKDLGSLRYFLSIEIARAASGICLSQRKYALQLLDDTGFLASKPVVTPMDPRSQLNSTDGDLLSDHAQYRRIVGRLLYLTLSCPDITFAVHKLSQFISKPQTPHLHIVHHILPFCVISKVLQAREFSSTLHLL